MTAKEISFNTPLFYVTLDNIEICYPVKIEKIEIPKIDKKVDGIRIYYIFWYLAELDHTELVYDNRKKLFLNLSDAQKEQAKLRQDLIDRSYSEMIKYQAEYSDISRKYYNLPLSNPYKNEN